MREIEFRGKREDNGEWVYGYYVKSNGHLIHEGDYGNIFTVIPETVGQFTNRYDIEGEKVYEGDIFKYTHTLGEYRKMQFSDNPSMYSGIDVVGFENSEFVGEHRYLMLSMYGNIEVIGNKYDDLELMDNLGTNTDEYEWLLKKEKKQND